jgi:hypothetical protein
MTQKEINMSTYDAKARMEQLEREHDEWAEKIRIKNRKEMRPIWGLLGLGIFCMSLGFMLARSI